MTIAHGCLLNRTPVFIVTQTTRDSPRKAKLRLLPESNAREQLPHFLRLHRKGNFCGADIGGLLNHLRDSQCIHLMRIMNRCRADSHMTWCGLKHSLRCDATFIQRQGNGKRFECGTWFKRIC